jgi:hypothetical protein
LCFTACRTRCQVCRNVPSTFKAAGCRCRRATNQKLFGASVVAPAARDSGAFGRASAGFAPRAKPGALSNGLKNGSPQEAPREPLLWSTSAAGVAKNRLPGSSRGCFSPFASPSPSGVHQGTAVAGAREDGQRLQGRGKMVATRRERMRPARGSLTEVVGSPSNREDRSSPAIDPGRAGSERRGPRRGPRGCGPHPPPTTHAQCRGQP